MDDRELYILAKISEQQRLEEIEAAKAGQKTHFSIEFNRKYLKSARKVISRLDPQFADDPTIEQDIETYKRNEAAHCRESYATDIKIMVNHAHKNSPYSVVSIISSDLSDPACKTTIGSGENSYEAVWDALGMALLAGHEIKNWVARVYHFGDDGSYSTPSVMDQNAVDVLKEGGIQTIEYVMEDGSILR